MGVLKHVTLHKHICKLKTGKHTNMHITPTNIRHMDNLLYFKACRHNLYPTFREKALGILDKGFYHHDNLD